MLEMMILLGQAAGQQPTPVGSKDTMASSILLIVQIASVVASFAMVYVTYKYTKHTKELVDAQNREALKVTFTTDDFFHHNFQDVPTYFEISNLGNLPIIDATLNFHYYPPNQERPSLTSRYPKMCSWGVGGAPRKFDAQNEGVDINDLDSFDVEIRWRSLYNNAEHISKTEKMPLRPRTRLTRAQKSKYEEKGKVGS